MLTIVSCSCGAKIRVPEGSEGKAYCCPRCKADVLVPFSSSVTAAPPESPVASAAGASCPICQTVIADGEPAVSCPTCQQVHHRECWTEVGGCGTYGCEKAPAPI